MKKYLIGLVLALASTLSQAQNLPGNTFYFTLEDCIEYAINNNYSRQSLDLDKSALELNYLQSKNERLPSLSGSVSQAVTNVHENNDNLTWTGNYGLTTSMTLYNGGTINNTIELNKLRVEQADYQNKQYDNDLTINVIQVFLEILGNDELLKYQKALVETSEEQLNQGRQQLAEGAILESDYLLLEAQYATDQYNVINTELTRDNRLLSLKSLLSLSPNQKLNIIHPDTSILSSLAVLPSLDEVMSISLQTLPDISINNYNIYIAESDIKLSKAGYYPTLSLGAGINTGYNSINSNGWGSQFTKGLNEQASLTLSIPIFSRGQNKTNVLQSQIRLKQAELSKNQTELVVMQQIEQDYQNMVSAYTRYEASKVKENAYRASFDAYREQFKYGSITTVDLLLQQNNYISSLNDYIQSKYTFLLNRKILDVYMDIPVKL